MAVSLTKYVPQMVLNFQNKSTIGWSIENIILDLGGGIFSLLQIVVDSIVLGNISAITGNPVKFGMGMTSIVFDLIFILQHYWLYPRSEVDVGDEIIFADEQAPLIQSDSVPV
jgi:cystinosin